MAAVLAWQAAPLSKSRRKHIEYARRGKGRDFAAPSSPCLFSFPHPALPIETLICLSSQNHEKNWGILIGYLKKGEGVKAALVVGEGGSNKGGGITSATHQWRLVRQAFAVVQLCGRIILIGAGCLCHLLVVIAAVKKEPIGISAHSE